MTHNTREELQGKLESWKQALTVAQKAEAEGKVYFFTQDFIKDAIEALEDEIKRLD